PVTVAEIVELTGARLVAGDEATAIAGVAPLEQAAAGDLAFLDNPKYATALETTGATVVIVARKFAARAPAGAVVLESTEPYRAFAKVAARLFPAAVRLEGAFAGEPGVAAGAHVHATARIEEGATIEPGAVVGAGAEVGRGTVVSSGAVVGAGVRVGRDGYIGPGATLIHALLGNRVIIHPGVRIGQDGFGFAMGPQGHLKVPQVGRVIIQDDVEIGANTTIDRGATRDTIVGEGTKIDNLVQLGHNVVIGRHCVIVAQVGISGSTTLEDFVAIGGQVGIVGHVRIGMGAQIAASSNVNCDVPPGARWGGTPAKPVREWFREITALKHLAERGKKDGEAGA
ncbi:MAG TPA: UDP-3-O-(3-hydroxymyristoyl)glucosamine N-acyltransferase, partial [Kaistiaceae bacterium]|nr:UDP-3-O-(3-hydroxymyristoyl)glucosamine N-acyltransferase [Kaistiaceae bacterium]